jgi:radical SAM protein with 4Fe4S-binding SPASM domain
MSFEEFLNLKEELKKITELKRIVFCGIGESLLNKQIYEILKELRDYTTSLVTSGTILIDYPRLDQWGNVDMLIFSIDATNEEAMKNICGKNYNFANLLTNLDNYYKYKKTAKSKLKTLLNTTVHSSNIDEIGNIMDFATKHKFLGVHYSLQWGSEAFIIQNLEKLRGAFFDTRKKAKKYGIYWENPFKSYCCLNVDSILCFVDIDGNVYPCGFGLNRQYKVGNLFDDSFDNIWESSAYNDFKKGKLCDTCYMLRMTDINTGKITLDDIKGVHSAKR